MTIEESAAGGTNQQEQQNSDVRPVEQQYRVFSPIAGLDQAACDFIAGMTDRYAIRLFEQLFIPKPWAAE